MADKKNPAYEAEYQAAFAPLPEKTPATAPETTTLGELGGKFHFSFKLRRLDAVNDPGQGDANALEVQRQALNLGWLLTAPAEIVATTQDEAADTRGGGTVTYAAPCVANTLENRDLAV